MFEIFTAPNRSSYPTLMEEEGVIILYGFSDFKVTLSLNDQKKNNNPKQNKSCNTIMDEVQLNWNML